MKFKFALVLIIVGVGLYLIKKSEPIRRDSERGTEVTPVNDSSTGTPTATDSILQAPSHDKVEAKTRVSLVTAAPNKDTLREEVKQNPHVTPPSIVQFAAELGLRMKEALQSESAARDLFPELQNCAQDLPKGSFAFTPRALCYSDADQLSRQFPVLQNQFENLKGQLDPETKGKFSKLSELTR